MPNNLETEKKVLAVSMLAEGSSIRAIERVTGIHRDTVMRLGVRVGEACAKIHDEKMHGVASKNIEVDEIWGFIGAKRKNAERTGNYGDVCDLITGGFPCQPFSVAGKQRGTSDDRYLWPAMLAVIAKCQPAWVLGENVAGLVNMELDRCFSDLENLGYEVQPIIVPACATDARHRRDRVWIIGYAKHARLTTAEIGGSVGTGNDDSAPRTEQASEPAGSSEQLSSLAHAYGGRFGECESEAEQIHGTRGTGESNRKAAADADGRNSRKSSERQGREDSGGRSDDSGRSANAGRKSDEGYCRWQPEPAICRVANGIPNRVDKLRGLGNAIVPQVAETILKQITRVMENS